MEEVKISGQIHPERYYYEWRFTREERERLRDVFRFNARTGKTRSIAAEKNVEAFINHLEFLCQGKIMLLKQPQKIDIREKREAIIKDCKTALKHLKKIERGHIQTWYQERLDFYGSPREDDPVTDFIIRELQSAWDAVGPLEKFIKILEKHHGEEVRKNGRPEADGDNFIKKIRNIYAEHIGKKPTKYENGPFVRTVRAVREILGLRYEYPRRTIERALK